MIKIVYRLKRKFYKLIWSQEKYYSWEENEGFRKTVVQKHYPLCSGKSNTNSYPQVLISMFNGFERHGGLADRFRGVISSFYFAKKHNLKFAIYWNSPFRLGDYLVPNRYNWKILEDAISYYRPCACPIHIGSFYKRLGLSKEEEENFQEKYLISSILKNNHSTQFHVYSNAHFGDDEYHDLFQELFKPSTRLQKMIDDNVQKIGRDFLAVSFRFMQLLGDFKDECGGASLDSNDKKTYIKECIEAIEAIHKNNETAKILVTSDSELFLSRLHDLSYVYIIPGKISHTDGTSNVAQSYDKEFLDLFVLSKAKVIYRIHKGKMHYSGFPITAGMIGGVEVIDLEL